MYRKSWMVAVSIFSFLLAACSLPNAQANPTATPPQALSPAGDYVSGLSEVSPDRIILVLVRNDNSGSGSCNFPVVEQAPLPFWYFSGALEISSSGSSGWLSDNNLIDVSGREIKGLGFFGFIESNDYSVGGGVHTEIYYIDQLPFVVSSISFVIHSALKDGTIIADVGGTVYQFKPNQSWVQSSSRKYENNPDCLLTNTSSITNYGLLDVGDVKFVDEPILP